MPDSIESPAQRGFVELTLAGHGGGAAPGTRVTIAARALQRIAPHDAADGTTSLVLFERQNAGWVMGTSADDQRAYRTLRVSEDYETVRWLLDRALGDDQHVWTVADYDEMLDKQRKLDQWIADGLPLLNDLQIRSPLRLKRRL